MRLICAICSGNQWIIGTSDVKSAFLQGRRLDREVIVQPPREAVADLPHLILLVKDHTF